MFCDVRVVREQRSLKSVEVVFGSIGDGGFSVQPSFLGLCFVRPERPGVRLVFLNTVLLFTATFDYRG